MANFKPGPAPYDEQQALINARAAEQTRERLAARPAAGSALLSYPQQVRGRSSVAQQIDREQTAANHVVAEIDPRMAATFHPAPPPRTPAPPVLGEAPPAKPVTWKVPVPGRD
jgi:hypothetical protein